MGGGGIRDDQHSASLRQVSGGRGRRPCDITERQARRLRGGGQRPSTFSVTTPGQWDEADARVTSQSVRLIGWGGDGGGGDQRRSTFSVTTPGQWGTRQTPV